MLEKRGQPVLGVHVVTSNKSCRLSSVVVRALDLYREIMSLTPGPHCRVATLGKLFTLMCLCRCKWSSGGVSDS